MSDPTKAVFLSYAREDTDAARRIADALRAFGVEVWFDQSELRGGDSWDAKIKKQIRECALFLPLVSQKTQERTEGYFRREWLLAVERTRDMAHGVAFIVPVVIDETREADAAVPEEFMRYHWTRLAHGVPSPQFVEQVKKLLETPRKPAAVAARPTETVHHSAPKKSNFPLLMVGAVAVAAIGVALYLAVKPAVPVIESPKPAVSVAGAAIPPATVVVADKSIAVLPFANMSSDKENEFFTDGIHEDILTNLALIRDVRVVSRTSVMEYRGTTKKIRQIGAELGVAWLLEGSVQRAGNKVRVTGQLIRANNDEHLWAKSYDRDLTDVFTIQGELATAIAGALQSVLSPEAKAILEHRPTDNPAAYDLYLKARHLRANGSVTEQRGITPLLEQAVQLDPKFAAAWGELGSWRTFVWFNMDQTAALLAKAKEAIETAVRLAPDDPVVIRGQGDFYYYGFRDYARATEHYARLAQLRPNDSVAFWSLALIQRRQGRFADSWENLRRAMELDPTNSKYAIIALELLTFGRRYTEGEALARKSLQAWPENLQLGEDLAFLTYSARGSTAEMTEFARRVVPPANRADHIYYQRVLALCRADGPEVMRLDALQRHFESEDDPPWAQDVITAFVLAEMGNMTAARERMHEALTAMQAEEIRQAGNYVLWTCQANAHAFLGNKEESMRCREKALALMPPSRDALDGATAAAALAVALAWSGEKERALAEFERLLHLPWGTNIFRDRGFWNGSWKPLRDDPRFKALLSDPKNNEPLF